MDYLQKFIDDEIANNPNIIKRLY